MMHSRFQARCCRLVGTVVAYGLVVWYSSAVAASLQFAGRTWDIKQASSPVGPGPNRFSDSPNDVWSDQSGLHLSIHKTGPFWYSTEVILNESLGYGTYMFQTDSRQDILNANAVFGAFIWDSTGAGPIPGNPNREIDFEDSRFGNPVDPTNSQVVVQPFNVPGNLERMTLPDLSQDSALTRILTWSPGKLEFTSLLGHHTPNSFAPGDVIHQFTYLDNGADHRVPVPHHETFRFNLWLFQSSVPVGEVPVEVLVNDFQYLPLPPADNTVLYDFETGAQGWGSFGAIGLASGELPTGGSIGQGRFHSGDFSQPEVGSNFGIVDVSPSGQDLSNFLGLSVDALFQDVVGQPPFVGSKELEIIVATGSEADGDEVEYRAPVTMTDTYQTFSIAFEDFVDPVSFLSPTPTQLTDVTIKLVVRNESGSGVGELLYDQITGLRSIDNADFDADLDVDGNDFLVWQHGFGDSSLHSEGDANSTASVNGDDIVFWESQFGVPATGVILSAVETVPEPSSLLLSLLLILGWNKCGAFRNTHEH
jgi:hypothetical protein